MPRFTSAVTKRIAVSSATTTTLLQLEAPSTIPITVYEWGISLNGTDSNDTPSTVELTYDSAALGSPLDTVAGDGENPAEKLTSETSVRIDSRNTEASVNTYLEQHNLTPIGGLLNKQYPLGREIIVPQGEFLSLRVAAPTSDSVASATGFIKWEE